MTGNMVAKYIRGPAGFCVYRKHFPEAKLVLSRRIIPGSKALTAGELPCRDFTEALCTPFVTLRSLYTCYVLPLA